MGATRLGGERVDEEPSGLPASARAPSRLRTALRPEHLIFLVFLGLLGVGVLRHEMWRDEMDSWSVARNLPVADLVPHLRYLGHPSLWYLLLLPLAALTTSPLAIQGLQTALAAAAGWIWVTRAPFPLLLRGLFLLGYFPLFEYGIKSRPYVLSMLFLFVLCDRVRRGDRHGPLFAIALFLLWQTNLMGAIVAAAFLGALLTDWLLGLTRRVGPPRPFPIVAVASTVLAAACFAWQVWPPADSGYAAGLALHPSVEDALASLSLVASANLGVASWPGSLVLLAGVSFAVRRSPGALVFFWSGTGALLLFFLFKYQGAIWHHGFLFLLPVAALWMSAPEASRSAGSRREQGAVMAGFALVLAVQAFMGLRFYAADLAHPYSAARATARYIEREGLADLPIVGDADYASSTVAGYLDRPFFYPLSGRWSTFMVWKAGLFGLAGPARTWASARYLASLRQTDVLLVLDYRLAPGTRHVRKLASFPTAMVGDEVFHLYLFEADPPGAAGAPRREP